MLLSFDQPTRALVIHLIDVELRLCLLERMSGDDAIVQVTASLIGLLGSVRGSELVGTEGLELQELIGVHCERLVLRQSLLGSGLTAN